MRYNYSRGEMNRLLLIFTLLLSLAVYGQTSTFVRTFETSAGSRLTGAVIYIVNQSTSDSLLLTEDVTRPGRYYRTGVASGLYKIYINAVLKESNYPWGGIGSGSAAADHVTIDTTASGEYRIKDGGVTTAKIEDSTITEIKLSPAVVTKLNTSGGGVSEIISNQSISPTSTGQSFVFSENYTNTPSISIVSGSDWGVYYVNLTNLGVDIIPNPIGGSAQYAVFDILVYSND